jgi:nitrogen fixation NifU-like protein
MAPFTASIAAMYQDGLLAHHRAPHNRRVIDAPTAVGARKNPVCGDDITVMVVLDTDAVGDTVRDVAFTGRGCSIATASASMMTDAVAGLTVGEALAAADAVERMLHASGADAIAASVLPAALTPLLGVAPFPGRHGCAMLPWQALREALTAKR